jgi:hypothetical protein
MYRGSYTPSFYMTNGNLCKRSINIVELVEDFRKQTKYFKVELKRVITIASSVLQH